MKYRFFKVVMKTLEVKPLDIQEGDQLDFLGIMDIIESTKINSKINYTEKHGFSIIIQNEDNDFILFVELKN